MRSYNNTFAPLIFSVLLIQSCTTQSPTVADRIEVRELKEEIAVTVPKSRVTLTLPRGDLRQNNEYRTGASASPRYFMLIGHISGLVVSGWFEPAEREANLRASWNAEMAGMKRSGFAPPTDVVDTEIQGMKIILYNIPLPTGSSAHARSSIVRSGTWIDLHLSVSGDKAETEAREQLLLALRSLQFTEKP